MQFQEYLRSNPEYLLDSQYIEAFQTMLTNATPNESAEWKYHQVKMKGLIDSIDDFNNASYQKAITSRFGMFFLMTWHQFWLTLTNPAGKEIQIWISLLFAVLYFFLFLQSYQLQTLGATVFWRFYGSEK